ncbi:MAG: class I SAM-dependent methyltransferase [Acidimicrobiia bacterium]
MEILDEVRRFWNDDAAGYDKSPGHRPLGAERAAWVASLVRLLPPPPARVLDVGAGTGFLSLLAAGLGHRVTALDISPGMLEVLTARAREEGLPVEAVEGSADSPPPGPFDAVMERHLVWTLPHPLETLRAWREVAPAGTLVLFESSWGVGAGTAAAARRRLREALRQMRGVPPDHHAPYPSAVRSALPLGSGTPPAKLLDLTERAGWGSARLERLRDVEWAASAALPLPERLLGTAPRFVIAADASRPAAGGHGLSR